jgi:SAM-dependent methyltransferase
LKPWWDTMTDEQARLHEGPEHPVEEAHLRAGLRLFHAWRVHVLRERLGDRLKAARILDVGDVDGLILRALGKSELGFNLAADAIANIEANGVRAVQGDGHRLPFEDGSFDAVLCFETLEHVESPAALLEELARVCSPEGAVYLSIPWVPRTFIHPRDRSLPRGHQHVFEFSRADFGALAGHTPLEIAWEARCDTLGPATRAAHQVVLGVARLSHIVAGGFHRFQFFELRHREPR